MWTSVATPEYLSRKPKNRRLVLNAPASGGGGAYASVNMVSQVYRGRQEVDFRDMCCMIGWIMILTYIVHLMY